ncbi:hypothetical protein BC832DRAFT_399161 [Gaertneriomyces semiglobifer]|nr:hypothetical protein BC832DRAFT_399161 [Gaertneriomyces semiglobifer]
MSPVRIRMMTMNIGEAEHGFHPPLISSYRAFWSHPTGPFGRIPPGLLVASHRAFWSHPTGPFGRISPGLLVASHWAFWSHPTLGPLVAPNIDDASHVRIRVNWCTSVVGGLEPL